ncbi:MAG: hypothetical protein MJ252_18975 [archaeon]|nr:hypothetical protein [archaeon]
MFPFNSPKDFESSFKTTVKKTVFAPYGSTPNINTNFQNQTFNTNAIFNQNKINFHRSDSDQIKTQPFNNFQKKNSQIIVRIFLNFLREIDLFL